MTTPLQIEAGKHYRLRAGHEFRCYATGCGGVYDIHGAVKVGDHWEGIVLYEGGKDNCDESEAPYDIISEWRDEPVVDWSVISPWFNAVIQNPSGRWNAVVCDSEPKILDDEGWCNYGQSMMIPTEYAPKFRGDWKDSLVRRPV